MQENIASIHALWFGELDARGLCIADKNSLWFKASDETDAMLRRQFGPLLDCALAGQLDDWLDSDASLIALIILLDQFSRNIHRGTPEAFAADARALALAQDAIKSSRHELLPLIHRVFLYLPLEHSEDIALQEQCVRLFQALAKEAGEPQFDGFTRYAVSHRDVIAQFGRFPHRNTILGRESTRAELTYLEKHGGF